MYKNRIKYFIVFICLTTHIVCSSYARNINIDALTGQISVTELLNISPDTLNPGYAIFGEVSPKITEFSKFGKFQKYEIYTIASNGKQINGIERFGPYRLYTSQEFDTDTNYRGYPRIEFLNESGKLIKVVIPTDNLDLLNKQKVELLKTTGKGTNNFAISRNINVSNIESLLKIEFDTINIDRYLRTEFDIQNNYLLIKVGFYGVMDMGSVFNSYELMVFDALGDIVGRSIGEGQLNIADITSNGEYLYLSTGGPISENRSLKYQFRIIDLKNNKVILNREEAINERIAGFTIQNTNLGVYTVESTRSGAPNLMEAYVIDHDLHRIYSLHTHKSCPPGSFIYYNTEYCECVHNNSSRVKLYYRKEFSSTKLND